MKLCIGNFKGKQGEPGKQGERGLTGDTGPRGSRLTSGIAITGTSTIGAKFPDSGIADAQLYDHYINIQTGNLYECITAGTANMAEWVYIGNMKGPTGNTGPAGSISDIDNQKPTYVEATKLENINSGETVKITFGKLKKAVSVLISHYTQKATASILGHVKLSNSTAITTAGEYALDAVEKNASVAGTLANQIAQQNSKLRVHRIYSGDMKVGEEYDSLTGTLDYSVLLYSLRWSQYQFCMSNEDTLHLYSNYLMQDTSYYCEFHALVKFYRDRNKIAVLKAYQENRQSNGDFKFEIDTIPLTIYGCNIIRF